VAGEAKAASEGWQEVRLKRPVEARSVRLTVTTPRGEPRLGGLAEVELWPVGKGDANRGGPTPDQQRGNDDRQRGTSGHAKATPGHERDKPGKRHNEAKDQQGSTEQTVGDNDQPGSPQDPNHDQAKPGQHRNPDLDQGKERNTGPERKKDTAKSTHKRAQRRGGR